MGKGSGGSSGSHSAGGVGGRTPGGARGDDAAFKRLAVVLGAYAVGIGLGAGIDAVQQYGAEGAWQAAKYKTREAAGKAASAFAARAVPITGAMRDKVRAWADRRASEEYAKRTNPGAINTSGIAMDAVRGVLGSGKPGAPIPSMKSVGTVPPKSFIQFKNGGNVYSGASVKSLINDAKASADAAIGANQRKASRIDMGSMKSATSRTGKRQSRNLAKAKKAMKKS